MAEDGRPRGPPATSRWGNVAPPSVTGVDLAARGTLSRLVGIFRKFGSVEVDVKGKKRRTAKWIFCVGPVHFSSPHLLFNNPAFVHFTSH